MFGGASFQTYYGNVAEMVKRILDREAPDYLLRVDFDEYLKHLVSEITWDPLEWDESQMTVERFVQRVQLRDEWEPRRTYDRDVQRFRLRIPLSPHPQRDEYMKLMPSTMRFEDLPWRFSGDTLIVEVDATEGAVQQAIEQVRFWLGGRNKDIELGNRTLADRIRPIWEARRRRLEEDHKKAQSELEKLNIPIYRDPSAKVKPVEIKPRELRVVVPRPSPKPAQIEPSVDRGHVVGLVDFIEQYVRTFEVTPNTYAKLDEEELRDLLLGMMNANYPGSATAETFSKLGKTDIHFRVDSGNVLICECKVWRGAKEYHEAIDQLFRYLTWRHNYGVLIAFCRNKNMTAAIESVTQTTRTHASFVGGSLVTQNASRFLTRHTHPQDAAKLVEVFHVFVDLSVQR